MSASLSLLMPPFPCWCLSAFNDVSRRLLIPARRRRPVPCSASSRPLFRLCVATYLCPFIPVYIHMYLYHIYTYICACVCVVCMYMYRCVYMYFCDWFMIVYANRILKRRGWLYVSTPYTLLLFPPIKPVSRFSTISPSPFINLIFYSFAIYPLYPCYFILLYSRF